MANKKKKIYNTSLTILINDNNKIKNNLTTIIVNDRWYEYTCTYILN